MNDTWKQPARLWRWREHLSAAAAQPIETGSLEEMILRAVARGAARAEERRELFIDLGGDELFAWPEIRELYNSPTFPIDI